MQLKKGVILLWTSCVPDLCAVALILTSSCCNRLRKLQAKQVGCSLPCLPFLHSSGAWTLHVCRPEPHHASRQLHTSCKAPVGSATALVYMRKSCEVHAVRVGGMSAAQEPVVKSLVYTSSTVPGALTRCLLACPSGAAQAFPGACAPQTAAELPAGFHPPHPPSAACAWSAWGGQAGSMVSAGWLAAHARLSSQVSCRRFWRYRCRHTQPVSATGARVSERCQTSGTHSQDLCLW